VKVVTISSWLNFGRPREGGLRRGENFWLRLTTACAQCLHLSERFFTDFITTPTKIRCRYEMTHLPFCFPWLAQSYVLHSWSYAFMPTQQSTAYRVSKWRRGWSLKSHFLLSLATLQNLVALLLWVIRYQCIRVCPNIKYTRQLLEALLQYLYWSSVHGSYWEIPVPRPASFASQPPSSGDATAA